MSLSPSSLLQLILQRAELAARENKILLLIWEHQINFASFKNIRVKFNYISNTVKQIRSERALEVFIVILY